MASTPRSRAAIDLLKRAAAANPPGAPILRHPDFARKVARAEIALRALEATEMAVLRAVEQGREPGFEASLFKIRGTEIYQEITRLATAAAGVYGLLNHAHRGGTRLTTPGTEGRITAKQDWPNARKSTIYDWTNAIQANTIAKQVPWDGAGK